VSHVRGAVKSWGERLPSCSTMAAACGCERGSGVMRGMTVPGGTRARRGDTRQQTAGGAWLVSHPHPGRIIFL
jgi:hypothetical protein